MLFRYGGININKLELAKKVKYSPTPYKKVGKKIYFGDPNDGFVGNMYTFKKPGLGVYHKPIYILANTYFPNKMIDLTGKNFSTLLSYLSKGKPIWIITNTTYRPLQESSFQTWHTPNGPIKITYKEHSVLVTGYDKSFIYFNDPLTGEKNKKALKQQFINAWLQMGNQAITFK